MMQGQAEEALEGLPESGEAASGQQPPLSGKEARLARWFGKAAGELEPVLQTVYQMISGSHTHFDKGGLKIQVCFLLDALWAPRWCVVGCPPTPSDSPRCSPSQLSFRYISRSVVICA